MTQKNILFITGLSGALCVGLGAMGAHALQGYLPADNLITYETAVRYQLYHTLALLLVGILTTQNESNFLKYTAYLFIAGIILFSFSLYFLALRPIFGIENAEMKWIGAITPLGGLSFILAWLLLSISTIKSNIKTKKI